MRWLSLFLLRTTERAFSTRLAQRAVEFIVTQQWHWTLVAPLSTIHPDFSCKIFFKSILLELFRYIKHMFIYCFIQGMASNYEPTVISIPCMARGASALGHIAWFWDYLGLIVWTMPGKAVNISIPVIMYMKCLITHFSGIILDWVHTYIKRVASTYDPNSSFVSQEIPLLCKVLFYSCVLRPCVFWMERILWMPICLTNFGPSMSLLSLCRYYRVHQNSLPQDCTYILIPGSPPKNGTVDFFSTLLRSTVIFFHLVG